MALKRKLFEPQRSEEERAKDKSRVMTLRINKHDQRIIKELGILFDVNSEGTVLKIALHNYWHVLHQGLSPRYLRYLFQADRDRASNYKDLDKQQGDVLT